MRFIGSTRQNNQSLTEGVASQVMVAILCPNSFYDHSVGLAAKWGNNDSDCHIPEVSIVIFEYIGLQFVRDLRRLQWCLAAQGWLGMLLVVELHLAVQCGFEFLAGTEVVRL
jgi:hypothetical protein